MELVALEREGSVAWLRMNRAEAHNAFNRAMTTRMGERVRELATDSTVRAVVLAGNGPSFSTGVDVKELRSGELQVETFVAWHQMARTLRDLPFPLIVAIHGHCLGGGTMLTLSADYRLASSNVSIGLGALRLAILPGSAPELLPKIVGTAAARRLCLFGEYLNANEALRIGLVDRVVPADALEEEARALAERVAGFSPTALRECKRLLALSDRLSADEYEEEYRAAQQRCLDDQSTA